MVIGFLRDPLRRKRLDPEYVDPCKTTSACPSVSYQNHLYSISMCFTDTTRKMNISPEKGPCHFGKSMESSNSSRGELLGFGGIIPGSFRFLSVMTSQLQYHILEINPSSSSVTKHYPPPRMPVANLHVRTEHMSHVILLVTRILSGCKSSSIFWGKFNHPSWENARFCPQGP